jgi:hypothetical protein
VMVATKSARGAPHQFVDLSGVEHGHLPMRSRGGGCGRDREENIGKGTDQVGWSVQQGDGCLVLSSLPCRKLVSLPLMMRSSCYVAPSHLWASLAAIDNTLQSKGLRRILPTMIALTSLARAV